MSSAIKNLFAYRLAGKSAKRSGPFGKLAKTGLARRMSSRRGLTGRATRARVGARRAKMGLGALLGVAVVAAGAVGAKRYLSNRSHAQA